MISVLGYGSITAAGNGSACLFNGLSLGRDFSMEGLPKVCRFPENQPKSVQEKLVKNLKSAWAEATAHLSGSSKQKILSDLGIIFASTKGMLDDFIWDANDSRNKSDPLSPILNSFVQASELQPKESICVSNACTSTHAAFFLAKQWLNSNRVSNVLILAAESVGPFTMNGFSCLQAMTTDRVRPFGRDRKGLQLGEAAVAILISSTETSNLQMTDVALHSEGYAITRSSPDGAALIKAMQKIPELKSGLPDLIIAHGTGTPANDKVEDAAFSSYFSDCPAVTGTKWSVGHSLGASGAVDFVAACEVIRNQKAFSLPTDQIDPDFKGRYLLTGSAQPNLFKKILVSSVGFGGIHGALLLESRA